MRKAQEYLERAIVLVRERNGTKNEMKKKMGCSAYTSHQSIHPSIFYTV